MIRKMRDAERDIEGDIYYGEHGSYLLCYVLNGELIYPLPGGEFAIGSKQAYEWIESINE